jgi:hypothetical protein
MSEASLINDGGAGRPFPARLHVPLAREAPVALIFRRGNSKRVCTLSWDRRTDEIRVGQWLHGRIYERRSDLSPDGRHLIYFAMNGHWQSRPRGAWTAVSRAPWLKAIVLLGKGDCWHGGGLFTGPRTYWVNDGFGHTSLEDSREVRRDDQFRPLAHYGGECPGVHYLRLQRDGWALRRPGDAVAPAQFQKPLPRGWILRKVAHAEIGAPPGKGCYWDEHELEHGATDQLLGFPDWEWAELDGEQLLWTQAGRLYRADIGPTAIGEPRLVADLNGLQPENRVAPY